MFAWFSKRKNLTVHDVGPIIERFLADSPRYAQEWNDFVEESSADLKVSALGDAAMSWIRW